MTAGSRQREYRKKSVLLCALIMQINRTRSNSVVLIVFTGRCKPGVIDFSEAVVFWNRICAGSEHTHKLRQQ